MPMNIIALIIGILIVPVYIIWGARDYRLIKKDRSYLIKSYKGTIIFNIFLVILLSLISEYVNFRTDFSIIGKGVDLFEVHLIYIIAAAMLATFIVLPIVLGMKGKEIIAPGDFAELLPKSNQELFWFTILVVSVAIGEELIFREFYFELLNQYLGISGDTLLIVAAIIFGLVHFYQGIGGIIATMALGLFFGKVFQATESLIWPIIFHFIIDIKFAWNVLVQRYFENRRS